jgi:hypothetical protein
MPKLALQDLGRLLGRRRRKRKRRKLRWPPRRTRLESEPYVPILLYSRSDFSPPMTSCLPWPLLLLLRFQIASDSEDLDASDASTSLTPAQKKRKAAASLAAEKKKQSKKAAMSDLEFEDDEDDKGEGPSIGVRKSNVQSRSKTTAKQSAGPPAVGGFFKCGSCDKQATYVSPILLSWSRV